MESGAPCQWFGRLLDEPGMSSGWATPRISGVRATQTEDGLPRRESDSGADAVQDQFPRIWVPSEEKRDVRQLPMDRHHRMREVEQVTHGRSSDRTGFAKSKDPGENKVG